MLILLSKYDIFSIIIELKPNTNCNVSPLLAKCPTVDILHTKHWRDGDNGAYFYFSEEDFNEMVGNEDWDNETFDVIQEGSQSWTGRVIVWKGKFWNSGAHGRRDSGSSSGQWAAGDTIELTSCVNAGRD